MFLIGVTMGITLLLTRFDVQKGILPLLRPQNTPTEAQTSENEDVKHKATVELAPPDLFARRAAAERSMETQEQQRKSAIRMVSP